MRLCLIKKKRILYAYGCLLSLCTLGVNVWQIPPPHSISLLHSLLASPGFDGLPFANASSCFLCSGPSPENPSPCQCFEVFPFFSKTQFQIFGSLIPFGLISVQSQKGSNFSLGDGMFFNTLQIMSFLLSNKTKHSFAALSSVGTHDTRPSAQASLHLT